MFALYKDLFKIFCSKDSSGVLRIFDLQAGQWFKSGWNETIRTFVRRLASEIGHAEDCL
jgi:hypothetical protein